MNYRILAVALAAAFAMTLLPQTSDADSRGGCGGHGCWHRNGTALTGLESTSASGFALSDVLLPEPQQR